ncbi:ribonuclease P protein component [Desulfomarina sp.]
MPVGQGAANDCQPEPLEKLRLRKNSLLRKGWEFERVYSRGRRLHGHDFTLICEPNSYGRSRLGISVHHKIRGAVKRNRIKRIVRESFRLGRNFYPSEMDIVFAVRPGFSLSCPDEISESVASVVRKMHKSS